MAGNELVGPTPDDMENLAASVGVADFDLLLAGDGSGNQNTAPCGWACFSYYRPRRSVRTHFGGASGGSNNVAELTPYCHVLALFHDACCKSVSTRRSDRPSFEVLIVTDSEVTARCGDGTYGRNANLHLWAAIDYFVKAGYRITWKHAKRNSSPPGEAADLLAGRLRRLMKEVEPCS